MSERLPAGAEGLAAAGVEFVRVTFADLHGICRGKEYPVDGFAGACTKGMAQTEAIMSVDLAHTVVAGFEHGFRDFLAMPDPTTLVRTLAEPTIAWCLADGVALGGEPFDVDPRGFLRRQVAALADLGLAAVAAPEFEFYLLDPATFAPFDAQPSMIYTTGPLADPRGVTRELMREARAIGLRPTVNAREYGRGQFEINLDHGPALDAADRGFRFKTLAKEVAARHGLLATFMGRPNDDEGSGFHLHVSLVGGDGANAFADPAGAAEHGLSATARSFAAGVLAHLPALTALLNPTVNAYRRMVVESLAPTHVNWGLGGKLAAIRFPVERGAGTRLEVRTADGAANPYLVVGAILAAGRDGIERGLPLGPPVADNPYDDPATLGPLLPSSLPEALAALAADDVLRAALGEGLHRVFDAIKRCELDRWAAELARVTGWERREYGPLL